MNYKRIQDIKHFEYYCPKCKRTVYFRKDDKFRICNYCGTKFDRPEKSVADKCYEEKIKNMMIRIKRKHEANKNE